MLPRALACQNQHTVQPRQGKGCKNTVALEAATAPAGERLINDRGRSLDNHSIRVGVRCVGIGAAASSRCRAAVARATTRSPACRTSPRASTAMATPTARAAIAAPAPASCTSSTARVRRTPSTTPATATSRKVPSPRPVVRRSPVRAAVASVFFISIVRPRKCLPLLLGVSGMPVFDTARTRVCERILFPPRASLPLAPAVPATTPQKKTPPATRHPPPMLISRVTSSTLAVRL